jgi:alpha-tubulin suppressor-like RCC1 family protein
VQLSGHILNRAVRNSSLALAIALFLVAPAAFCAPAVGRLVSWGAGQVFPNNGPTDIVAISTATDHSLALKSDGTVFAWGDNMNGQCDVPAGLANVTEIAAGEFFSVALRSDRSIVAWGANDYGQRDLPSGLSGVTDISAGRGHVLALKNNGTVVGWGCDVFGQATVPTGLTAVKSILAAGNYSVAVKTNGTVVAWGANDSGQTNLPSGLRVKAVAGSTTWCMALRTNNTVVAWGQPPTLPAGLNNIAGIAAGQDHGLALTSAGAVIAWGTDSSGETTVPSSLPRPFAIAASWHHSAALATGSVSIAAARLINPRLTGNNFVVSFDSQTGVTYVLEGKDSLADSSWTPISTGTGTGSLLTLTNNSASSARRVYRVRAQ